ncbi:MAG: sel1 repeat family protein [Clostridia bacterium]|nr:sel1 repeat family protein [Clostridia bacterium]
MLENYLQMPTNKLKEICATDELALEALSVRLYQQRNENLQEFLDLLPLVENSTCSNALFYYGLHFYSEPPQNYQLACSLFEKSANLGHAYSQYCFALALFYGEGVEKNIENAIKYLTLSAENNHPQAISTLAEIYYTGEGIEQDIDKAIFWYEKAKEQNNCTYLYNLAKCYEIKGNLELATKYFKQSYNLAYNVVNDKSFIELFLKNSLLYEDEDFIFNSPDSYTALKTRATLFNNLNLMLLSNSEQALNELLSTTNSTYSNQNYVVGRLYEIGYNCEQRIQKAIEYYTLASEQGHPMAYDRLGDLYSDGVYVQKDLLKAQNFYRLASIGGFERQKYSDNSGGFSYIPISSEKTQKRGLTSARIKYALLFEKSIPDLLRVAKNSELITKNEKAGLLITEEFYLKLVRAEFIVAYNNSNGGKQETEELLLFHIRHPELDTDNAYLKLLDYVKTYSHSPALLKYFNALTLSNDENLIFVNICNCDNLENVVEAMQFYKDKDTEKAYILKEKSAILGYSDSIYDLAITKIEQGDLSALNNLYELENRNYTKATEYLVNFFIANFDKNTDEYLPNLEKYAENKNVKALAFLLGKKINEKKYLLICLQMQEFSNNFELFKKRLWQIYHEEYDFENALSFCDDIIYKNAYKLLLGRVDTFTNHDVLLDFYFRFKRILFNSLNDFNSEIKIYKQDLINESNLSTRINEICDYLNEYSNRVTDEKTIEIITLLTASLLHQENLVKRAVFVAKKDYHEATELLKLAKDSPYAKYNLYLLENTFNKKRVGFFAKNKLKNGMLKLQKTFMPAYEWVKTNYPNKAVKPNDTNKINYDLLLKD